MCVTPQHAQVLVTGDARDLHNVQPLLEQPSGCLVAQVMETEILDAGPSDGAHVGALHGLGGAAGKHIAMQSAGQGAQYGDGSR